MKRCLWLMLLMVVTACGASPTEVINTWANAVQQEDYAAATTLMLNPDSGWDLRASDVHRGLTYQPHHIVGDPANEQTVMVQWETNADPQSLSRYVCSRVRVQDGKLVVDQTALCTKDATFDGLVK